MLTYPMENRGGLPLYEYLYRCIRSDILSGVLSTDERLPSKRALAEHLRLSVITVEGAYQQLEAEGYVYTRPKRGFFVAAVDRTPKPAAPTPIPEEPPAQPWRLDLRSNQVDGSRFPVSTWARLTRQVLSEGGAAILSPAPHQGLLALRQAIAGDLWDFKGMAVSPEQIVVGAGAEYLYLLLAQLLGRDAVFAVEDPGYPKIRQVYGKCGAVCRPVPLDRQGMDTSPRPITIPPAPSPPSAGGRHCCGGRSRPAALSSRMTMTASSASPAAPFPRCKASTAGGWWSI